MKSLKLLTTALIATTILFSSCTKMAVPCPVWTDSQEKLKNKTSNEINFIQSNSKTIATP